jgi:hypothetical protein
MYRDDTQQGYLDLDKKLHNYNTEPVVDNTIFDTKHSGMLYYDQFLTTANNENLKGEVVLMTPEEYYQECANVCWAHDDTVTAEQLKYERGTLNRKNIEKLKTVVQLYKRKLCMPVIDYTVPTQEGLHRMFLVGELYGWDYKVPVLKVTFAC